MLVCFAPLVLACQRVSAPLARFATSLRRLKNPSVPACFALCFLRIPKKKNMVAINGNRTTASHAWIQLSFLEQRMCLRHDSLRTPTRSVLEYVCNGAIQLKNRQTHLVSQDSCTILIQYSLASHESRLLTRTAFTDWSHIGKAIISTCCVHCSLYGLW
jgi:hypothetical protein